jgi:predicted lipoprotein with Yx(FWY)xxD motif
MKEFSSLRTLLLIGAGAASLALPANAAPMLTAENGMTVYAFDKDVVGEPTCYDACARKWPPYLTVSGE